MHFGSFLLLTRIVALAIYSSPETFPSFESLARSAPVIVIGIVEDSPEYGAEKSFPDGTTLVVREHRIRVREYLRGHGDQLIMIQTLGGKFKREGSAQELFLEAGGQPQLPEVGSELLLFLPSSGENTFMLSRVDVVRVERQVSGDRIVTIGLTERSFVPADVLGRFDRAVSEGHAAPFSVTIPISTVRQLVQKASATEPSD